MSEVQVHRDEAAARIAELAALLRSAGDAPAAAIAVECEALSRAIRAFHMEGIRFRMYNVDRLLRAHASAPPGSAALLEEVRRHLESAGFHTRSHQAPI
jgi:GAF domain-containing protein